MSGWKTLFETMFASLFGEYASEGENTVLIGHVMFVLLCIKLYLAHNRQSIIYAIIHPQFREINSHKESLVRRFRGTGS